MKRDSGVAQGRLGATESRGLDLGLEIKTILYGTHEADD